MTHFGDGTIEQVSESRQFRFHEVLSHSLVYSTNYVSVWVYTDMAQLAVLSLLIAL